MSQFVTIEGLALRQAMKIVSAIVERRNTIPILGHAKLSHSETGLRISGTDLDMEISADVDVIDGAGGEWSICISASVLAGIARVAGPMNVRIERAADDRATITLGDGAAFYEVCAMADNDYPAIAGERGALIEAFTNGMFSVMLEKVDWCVSTEEVRYYLNGVCWHTDNKGSRFVATDGHRMAICHYAKDAAPVAQRIIPRKAVKIISDHLAGKDVKLFSVDQPGKLDIVSPGLTIRTKLIDGMYPDYQRVLPHADKQAFTFDLKRGEIVAAIDRATALGGDRERAIRLYNADGRVALDQRSPDFGTATATTSAAWPTDHAGNAEAPSFGFKGRYLREVASMCQGPISMRMVDQGSPFSIHDEDDTMTRVLMPMRV